MFLRLGDRRRTGGNPQHAAAIGKDPVALGLGAGVKHHHIFGAVDLIQPPDFHALLVIAGVSLGGHDHHQRSFLVPFQLDAVQAPFGAGQQGAQQIRFEPKHHGLAFGVAETHVVFDQLGAILGDHHPGEKYSLVGPAFFGHGFDGRLDDGVHNGFSHGVIDNGSRRIGAHAARIGAFIPIVDRFVILGGNQWYGVFSIHKGEKACLFPFQEFFDDHPVPGLAKGPFGHHVVDGGEGLVVVAAQDDPLAGGQPFRLHHQRGMVADDVLLGRIAFVELLIIGGGNSVFGAQVLGEYLRSFQNRRVGGGAKGLDSGGVQLVHQAHHQWSLGAHDDEIDLALLGERDHAIQIFGSDINAFRNLGDSRIAGGAIKFLALGRFDNSPAEGVLPAA